jgi:Lipocalin-like domain
MKFLFSSLAMFTLALLVSCGNKKVETPVNDHPISGTGTKVWYYANEVTAAGDSDKGTGEERKASWTFNSNGTFAAVDGAETMNGTWKYDGATLSITATGDTVQRVFSIATTEKDKLVLKNPDGSMMQLKTK